ncbi:cyclic phosphodiesterase-like, partial [Thalictrum thalictroides]
VLETAAHCSKYFGDDIPNEYMLHVSLLFGDFTDEVKQRIIEKAEAFYPNLTSLSFQTSQLALWRTNTDDQTLETWVKVAEYDLV